MGQNIRRKPENLGSAHWIFCRQSRCSALHQIFSKFAGCVLCDWHISRSLYLTTLSSWFMKKYDGTYFGPMCCVKQECIRCKHWKFVSPKLTFMFTQLIGIDIFSISPYLNLRKTDKSPCFIDCFVSVISGRVWWIFPRPEHIWR